MKFSDDGFDARRLRSRGASVWRWRVLASLATLAAAGGVLLALAGMATLLGHPAALGPLNAGIGAASILVLCGLVLLWGGVSVWRRCRRMRRGGAGALRMSPQLLKKRD